MKLEEKNLIVKRSYKEVYKCEEGIVKVFAKEHPSGLSVQNASECKRSDTDRWKMGSGDRVQRW